MKKIIFLSLLIAAAGCSKEINTGSVKSGSNNQTQINTPVADTYLPLTTGTNWRYRIVQGDDYDRSKLVVLGITKKINGKTYQEVKSVMKKNSDTVYYTQDLHNYYVYTNSSTSDADDLNLEILFLKDDAPVGASWTVPAGTADGVTLKCFGKIIEKDASIRVSDVVYTNVIHSYIEIRKPILFTYIVVSKQDFYVAKNIGIVKNESNILFPEASEATTNLTGYKIK